MKQNLNFKISMIVALIGICFPGKKIFAQYSGPIPSPAYVNTTESFYANTSGKTFLWTFENTPVNFSLASMPSSNNVFSGSPLSVPVYLTLDNDNGQWFSFVTNYSSRQIIRLNYGSSPQNLPTTTNLGVFGSNNQLEGIDIIRDNSGHWFGFAVNGNQLIRWEFSGNSLGGGLINVVTSSFPGFLAWPHQLNIKWFDQTNSYIGFVANRNGAITRLDFGNSLNNPPTLTNLPVVNYSSACNYALYNQNGSWYMITSNLLTGTISRIAFGTNIQNNTPSITNLGNPGGYLNIPRGIVLYPNCNPDQLIGYIINENGQFFKLDFNNDITNTPGITSLGALSSRFNALLSYTHNSSIKLLAPSVNANSIERINLIPIPQPNSINYFNSATTHIYNIAGPYTAALYTDPGGPLGPAAGCKVFKIYGPEGRPAINVQDGNLTNTVMQNVPNPFSDKTVITYYVDQLSKSASIVIYDLTGSKIDSYPLKGFGRGSLTIPKGSLSPGTYLYSLFVDGHKVDTKKMILLN